MCFAASALLAAAFLVLSVALSPLEGLNSDLRHALYMPELGNSAAVWALLTVAGASAFLALLSLAGLLLLVQAGRRIEGLLGPLALAAGYVLMSLAKTVTARPRPPTAPLPENEWSFVETLVLGSWDPPSYSYPSGHAMLSAVVYSYLALVLPGRRRALVLGIASLLVTLIGLARIVVGAHWPTDVLGGWLLGAAWLFIVLGARRVLLDIPRTRR